MSLVNRTGLPRPTKVLGLTTSTGRDFRLRARKLYGPLRRVVASAHKPFDVIVDHGSNCAPSFPLSSTREDSLPISKVKRTSARRLHVSTYSSFRASQR